MPSVLKSEPNMCSALSQPWQVQLTPLHVRAAENERAIQLAKNALRLFPCIPCSLDSHRPYLDVQPYLTALLIRRLPKILLKIHVQLSTHLCEIPKLQVFALKSFHFDRIMCRITAFRKRSGCLRNAAIVFITLPLGDGREVKTCSFQISDKCV